MSTHKTNKSKKNDLSDERPSSGRKLEAIEVVNETIQQLLIPDYTPVRYLYRLWSIATVYHFTKSHRADPHIFSGLDYAK
jgi:hypothetical protein